MKLFACIGILVLLSNASPLPGQGHSSTANTAQPIDSLISAKSNYNAKASCDQILSDGKNRRHHIRMCRDYLLSNRKFEEAYQLDKDFGVDEPIIGEGIMEIMNDVSRPATDLRNIISGGQDPATHWARSYKTESGLSSPLLFAIRKGDINYLRELLDFGVDPAPKMGDIDFIEAAHQKRRLDMVRLLFKYGATSKKLGEIMTSRNDVKLLAGRDALLGYVNKGNHDEVEGLLHEDVPATAAWLGATTLGLAIAKKDFRMVRLLKEAGVNFNAKKMAYLHGALIDVKILELLWPERMHQDQIDSLFAAACLKSQDTNLIDFLLEKGANIDGNVEEDRYTPLMYSMVNYRRSTTGNLELMYENAELFDHLLAKGADKEARNRDGMTPVMMAAELGQFLFFEKLIGLGAELSATSDDGRTVFDVVQSVGRQQLRYWDQNKALALLKS